MQECKILVIDNLWNRSRAILAAKGRIEIAGGYPKLAVLHWKKISSDYPIIPIIARSLWRNH